MLNYERKGIPICLLKNNDNIDDKHNEIIYFSSDDDDNNIKHPHTELDITEKNQKFCYIPNVKSERSIVYIAGKSGSGKSFYAKEYIIAYHTLFPKNPVYVFSYLKSDPTLDSMKFIKRVKITEPDFLETTFEIDDFKNSLVLFDDVDCIKEKKLRKQLDDTMNKILTTGRHHNVSCLCLSHSICNGVETKLQLNESHAIVVFLQGLGNRTLKYLLENYLGFSKSQIKKFRTLKSRSVTIIKSCPTVVLSDKKIYVLNNCDD